MKRRSIPIKKGFTRNRLLDRIRQFDQRSRGYSIADVNEGKPLKSYTWRCGDHFDQGSDGACVAFAIGHELAARPSEVKDISTDWLKETIYWGAQKIDPWDGGAYPGAYPNYEGTSVLAGAKMLKKLGYVDAYRWAFTPEAAMLGLGRNGPAVIGIDWHENMSNLDKNGFAKPTGRYQGGHSVLARAINIDKGYVTIRNSWGVDWGVDGDFFMTLDDFATILNRWGECCFMLSRTIHPDPE